MIVVVTRNRAQYRHWLNSEFVAEEDRGKFVYASRADVLKQITITAFVRVGQYEMHPEYAEIMEFLK